MRLLVIAGVIAGVAAAQDTPPRHVAGTAIRIPAPLATISGVHHLSWGIQGKQLLD